ncbi:hypothetical protein [Streptomyces sp. NPDC057682]|uniref:hypothetical protein n=1 Tax=Streptomyces sp. NPDC057682 TaxID=3346210 RepID=UPI0036ABE769
MTENWTLTDGGPTVPADEAVAELRRRTDAGAHESWFTSTDGRSLAFVTNTERAMVMLLAGEGDPGEHACDPAAGEEWSDGFVLANGQDDEYPDTDTVPVEEAHRIVHHIVAHGRPPADAAWIVDR